MSLDDQINSVDMNLKHMAEGMPHRIELEKKYHSQLNIKMMSIQEAQRIEHQKEQYREWLDQTNNRTNSPNFNKVHPLPYRWRFCSKDYTKQAADRPNHPRTKTYPPSNETLGIGW